MGLPLKHIADNFMFFTTFAVSLWNENVKTIIVRIARVIRCYVDGFKEMTVGKTLWAIILIKLFIIFFVLKLFLFPDYLNSRSDSEQGKAQIVRDELTK